MATDTAANAQADLHALNRAIASGVPAPPELVRRVEERAANIEAVIRQRSGVVNIAID
jgi:hypothetical protein